MKSSNLEENILFSPPPPVNSPDVLPSFSLCSLLFFLLAYLVISCFSSKTQLAYPYECLMMHVNANINTILNIGTAPHWWGTTGDKQAHFKIICLLTPICRLEKYIHKISPAAETNYPPPQPIPLHNKLFYWSGDNYLSHIIKHLEQIGGSNYRLPLGYPSLFIVLLLYITWWDLLCPVFP